MLTKRTVFLTCCAVLLLALVGSGQIGLAQDKTTVSLAPIILGVDQSGTVEATIDCAVDQCSAFAITLHFDPAIVRVEGAEVGPYLGERAFEAENVVDNTIGEVRLAAVALGTLTPSDETLLMRLEVTGITEGITALAIDDLEIGDALGNPLEVESVDGQVIVSNQAALLLLTATPTGTAEPCTVSTDQRNVYVRVGPGVGRGIRDTLPANVEIPVVGRATDIRDALWWKIQPPGYNEDEADRYWVAEADVTETGDCEAVEPDSAPPIVVAPNSVAPSTNPPTGGGQVCSPGIWSGCGTNGCGADYNSRCNASGTGYECVWNPGSCRSEPSPATPPGPSS